MEALVGFVSSIFRYLIFSFIFFWFGYLVIKIATFGRYPRTINPKRADCADYQLVSALGLLTAVGMVILAFKIWP
ncbi:hypothetical protein [Collimonas antrihumi]|uniref:hypothetical protein n=1 Tax=Collimonas antrihumi TaxID=1940615 RepID=UPI001B8AF651|nr:hypothetical protein [Collimonas antrihumi]